MKKPNTPDTPVRLLARMAASALRGNDLEPEELPEVASLLETVAGIAETAAEEENGGEPEIRITRTEAEIPAPAAEEEPEQSVNAADTDPEIISRLDRIISLLETMGTVPSVSDSSDETTGTVPIVSPEAEKVEEEMENLEEAVAELLSAEETEEEAEPNPGRKRGIRMKTKRAASCPLPTGWSAPPCGR